MLLVAFGIGKFMPRLETGRIGRHQSPCYARRLAPEKCSVAKRLELKITGGILRVGWPRDAKKTKKDFITYLKTLGFTKDVIYGHEKDGGLDILWLPPIGSIPHRPILSVQCKNGEFDQAQADVSVASGTRTLDDHTGLQTNIHVPCVLFNDYLDVEMLPRKRMNFVPLGLSDLATLNTRSSLSLI